MGKTPSAGQLTRWARRARTLHLKASDLYTDIKAVVGEDEEAIFPLAADTLCSAAELQGALKNRAIKAGSKFWE